MVGPWCRVHLVAGILCLLQHATLISAGKMEPAAANMTGVIAPSSAESTPKEGSASLYKGHASFMLLAGIAIVMGIFYMVNSPSELVAKSTWSMLNTVVSIFCAVMTYGLVNDVLKKVLKLPGEDGMPPGVASLISASIQLIVWWYIVVFLLFLVKSSALRLKGYGTVGGHILGFAALSVYGQLALIDAFSGSPWMTLLDIAIALLTMGLLFMTSRLVRICLQAAHCVGDEDDARWHDQSLDTGNDFFALCVGFLISMLMRFVITGKLPSIEGEMGGASSRQVWRLTLGGLALFVFGGVLAGVLHISGGDEESTKSRVLTFALSATMDAAAFAWLFAAMWKVGDKETEVMGHCIISLGFSVFAALVVLLLSRVPSGFLRGAFAAIGLMVGLSWEKTFDAASEGVAEMDLFAGVNREYLKVFLSLGLLLIVLPAWMVYILPKSDGELRKMEKLRVCAMCCDDGSDSEKEASASDGETRTPLMSAREAD